ncbi:MAG: hypothetical protein ABSA02_20120 [Trebonia sp.]|jgi:hypothetical protein
MGGSTLSSDYGSFVTGYQNTGAQSITENWESGDTVSINLSAVNDNMMDDPTQARGNSQHHRRLRGRSRPGLVLGGSPWLERARAR